MQAFIATIRPRSAFATPLAGDTLFGQLCWVIRHGWGEMRLVQLLDGYTARRPFLIIGDAFPTGHLPLPALPASHWSGQPASAADRKALKQRTWLPLTALTSPLENWQQQAVSRRSTVADIVSRPQPRNSLNRLTGTTGSENGFSPYTVRQLWHSTNARLDIHLRLDLERLPLADLKHALDQIGATGFGKDASVGLGKFDVDGIVQTPTFGHEGADAWLTLGPCAPQGLDWKAPRCFYRTLTRFGRHGSLAARGASPFKSPLLLAAAGALLSPRNESDWNRGSVGQGLGGDGSLSQSLPETVHQGYAPALPVKLPDSLTKREAA